MKPVSYEILNLLELPAWQLAGLSILSAIVTVVVYDYAKVLRRSLVYNAEIEDIDEIPCRSSQQTSAWGEHLEPRTTEVTSKSRPSLSPSHGLSWETRSCCQTQSPGCGLRRSLKT